MLFFLSVIALGACGGSGGGSPTGTIQGTSALPATGSTGPGPATGAPDWMARDAGAHDLLYVSNHKDGSVYAYSYPDGKLMGWLRGLRAGGLCTDGNGDLFVPSGDEIREYAHGDARAIAVLHDPLGSASQFCAVDPVSGNLAVSGGAARDSGLAVYPNAAGRPTVYASAGGAYWSSTYDNEGNLFVEAGGTSSKDAPHLLELPKTAARLRNIAWGPAGPSRLGSIQWDGKFLAAESPQSGSGPTTIFRYAVSGGRAMLEGRVRVAGVQSPLQLWIDGGGVAVPSRGSSNFGSSGVVLFAYPSGAGATQIVEDANEPQAAALSRRRHRKFAVTTYHYDNMRTGWNDKETVLNYGNVESGSFGLLQTVALDDQVDTQPLLVPDVTTTTGVSPGKHDVLYVATENDTVYAIDASSGTVLFQRSLGSPVPTPLGCYNNGPNVGIDGTPVIDERAGVMYVIAYTLQGSAPTYTLHELSIASLTDVVTPAVVSASHTLTNGYPFLFNATYQRQRAALLEANGTIYAGFGSFCDFSASQSRGWLLGWQAGSLAPISANQLNNVLATSPNDFFLSSIWMSGYGVAADETGNVYFVTGNSDPSGTSYNSVTNISETAAELSPDLTQVRSFFTPSDAGQLDQGDLDFGSGGMLLLPKVGSQPPLAAAAGKEGNLYLMNRRNMGGYTPSGTNHVVDTVNIGGCWCGPSYFDAASDSVPRIVASGGNSVTVWKVPTSRPIKLAAAGWSTTLPGGQDPGFFTSVSSNGADSGAIIWAVARPQSVPGNVTLFAFASEPGSGGTLQTLYQAPAGTWTSTGGNANLVPVVANGKVYVASYEQLDVFGLLTSKAQRGAAMSPAMRAPRLRAGTPNEVTGTLVAKNGSYVSLRTRFGKMVRVDDSDAVRRERSSLLLVGEAFSVQGKYDSAGVLRAAVILRAKPSAQTWPPDR